VIVDARVRVPQGMCEDVGPRPPELSERYGEVLQFGSKDLSALDRSDLDQLVEDCGIDIALVHGEFEYGDPADDYNRVIAELVSSDPKRYRGVGTISQQFPLDIMRALKQLEFCAEQGFVGVSMQPGFFHYALNEKRLYPVYAKANELGLAVFLHSGINYGSTHAIGNEHPIMLDEIACAFPGLKIIASHSAWPWINDMVAVARKHPTVYLEFGGMAPKYVGQPGSGWEVMYHFMNSVLQDQIMFGSDWPAFNPGTALEQWQQLDLKEPVLKKLLGENAIRIFELDG